MRAWVMALLLVAPVLSGCLGATGPDEGVQDQRDFETAWSEKALPFGDHHDHTDRSQHSNLSTPNFEVLGYDPLVSDYYGKSPGSYFCGDAKEVDDGRRLAAVESRSDVGFALADVTDPAAPVWLGELVMRQTHIYDLAVVPDGEHVVLVTSDLREEGLAPAEAAAAGPSGLAWRSPCTGGDPVPVAWRASEDPVPRPMSVILVDITDPAQPAVVDHQPLAGNGHSVYSTDVDGMRWAMVTTTRYPTPGPTGVIPGQSQVSAYEFYHVTDGPGGARLELLSIWKRPAEPDADDPARLDLGPRGHDGWLAKHPKTDMTLAYLVGHDRFTLLDMTDPRNPTEVGRWTEEGEGADGYTGHLHSAWALPELWNDRHYTIIGPEFAGHPEDHPSGILWVLDTTDPAQPFEVGAWTLPHEVEWSGTYMFSNHYYTVVDQTLLVSMYHGGIWAVDLSPLARGPPTSFLSLDSIGVFFAEHAPPEGVVVENRWAPTFEEVLSFDDGTLVTFDGNSGLYTLRFDATNPAPPPAPWPIEPLHPDAMAGR